MKKLLLIALLLSVSEINCSDKKPTSTEQIRKLTGLLLYEAPNINPQPLVFYHPYTGATPFRGLAQFKWSHPHIVAFLHRHPYSDLYREIW